MRKPSQAQISILVNKSFSNGVTTIKAILDGLEEKYGKDFLHETCSMQHAIDTDFLFICLYRDRLIEPVKPSKRQRKIIREWDKGGSEDWDSGDDGRGAQFGILEAIKWRSLKKRLPRFI